MHYIKYVMNFFKKHLIIIFPRSVLSVVIVCELTSMVFLAWKGQESFCCSRWNANKVVRTYQYCCSQ